jgi:hypothetical protein
MLWTMLNAACFIASVVAALGTAKGANASLPGFAIACAIGVAFGAASTWALWTVGERVASTVAAYPSRKREISFWVLYASAIPWAVATVVIVDYLTAAALHRI